MLSTIIIIVGLYLHAYVSDPIKLNSVGTYYLYDNNDNLIYKGSNKNSWVSLNDVSSDFLNAIISVEDKNFYKHSGFDITRIISALFNNFQSGKIVEGASTISQQYIKNAYLEFDKTWARKIKEALLTLNLEVHYSKDEILEAYINTINFGEGNYGINDASEYYFNKKPIDLSLEESILLAGIPKSPSHYNPISDYDNSIKRAKTVALTMYNNNYISKDSYNNLYKNKLNIEPNNNQDKLQMFMYFHDAVIEELRSLDHINDELINSGNLRVYTTLNYDYQKNMEKEILNNITDDNMQVASIVINPKDGAIMALTGGMDYSKSTFNRALYSKRQVGSTMKPFLYYAALNNGMTSSSTFTSQYTTFTLDNGKTYAPKNFNNNYANKDITMAAAIAYSDNIYAVKTNLFLGVNELINTAHLCGINEKLNEVASLALGTSEINLIDFANGYTTFASGGYKRNVHLINRVEDENGNILYEYERENNLVLNPNYVYILNELLTSTTNSSFIDYNTPTALNIASKMSQKYALKTGTTDTDYWTVGYNNNALMVMWTGYDNNDNIEISLGSKAKNTWVNVMEYINKDKEKTWYSMPSNVVGIPLNAIDGKKTNDSSKINIFYYLRGSEPIN